MINYEKYRIAVLGTGNIGKTLARSLASAGHSVKVANSRGPETIAPDVLETALKQLMQSVPCRMHRLSSCPYLWQRLRISRL